MGIWGSGRVLLGDTVICGGKWGEFGRSEDFWGLGQEKAMGKR